MPERPPPEERTARGRLKIFLGYASGVGKSFRMLDEGRRRRERGQDVVIAALQPKLSEEVRHTIAGLEIVPPQTAGGTPVMDVEAILARRPKICLVDGLAHNNPPGSRHPTRWEDVTELLQAGISVVGSVNLQRIAEKREQVQAITGRQFAETVPLHFLHAADEIVIVDAPASVAAEDTASVTGKLTQKQLSELREIALLLAAEIVDKQLERYLARHGIEQLWGTQERILIWLSPHTDALRMLESGIRNRDRFHGELTAIGIRQPASSVEYREKLTHTLRSAREQGVEAIEINAEDPVEALLQYARQRGITQIYAGHRGPEHWWDRLLGSPLGRLIQQAEGIDVRVFPYS